MSSTILNELFTETSRYEELVFESKKKNNSISNIAIKTYYPLTKDNNKIYIYSIGRYHNLTSILELPLLDSNTYKLEDLLNYMNKTFTDGSTNDVSLYGSTISYDPVNSQINFTLSIRATLKTKDYQIQFYDPGSKTPTDWSGIYVTDNTWSYNLHLSQSTYIFDSSNQYIGNPSPNVYTIKGANKVLDKNIYLTNDNNYFTIVPVYDASGGVYSGTTENDIVIKLDRLQPNEYYNVDEIINEINYQFSKYSNSHGKVLYGSHIYLNQTNRTTIRLNINTIYRGKDYILDFYDPVSFVHCTFGVSSSVQTVTWDTTLGWILGFRTTQIYYLTPENLSTNPSLNYTYYGNYTTNVYSYDASTNIAAITGDTSINVNLYNYFLIILDDYVQNRLNDGIVTTTSSALDTPLNSYTARSTAYRCGSSNRPENQNTNTNATYIGNEVDLTTGNSKTSNQLYAANQILNTANNRIKNPYQSSLGAYIHDIFGLIPVKTAGLKSGDSYVEFGGTLQAQERTYFGPVNIKRMTIRLITDKGTILDLNKQNWSFSFLIQQLYNPMQKSKQK